MSQTHAVALVVSDVDGTLVNSGRELTPATIAAVRKLHEAGLHFTIVTARPAPGVRDLIGALNITSPIACFNGALVVLPDLTPVRALRMMPKDVVETGRLIIEAGLDLWVYTEDKWYVSRLGGQHVVHQEQLVGIEAHQLVDVAVLAESTLKVVGVSDDYPAVERCEAALQARPDLQISATRSQTYYLDVTHLQANKGNAILNLSEVLKIPCSQIATIGDMPTDVLMFRKTGMSIAMGNASPEVQKCAMYVTKTNDEDGFAEAMGKYVLRNDNAR